MKAKLIAASIAATFILSMTAMQTASASERAVRIANGSTVQSGEFPDFVTLSRGQNLADHACGGVLVNSRWVLTAAHCIAHIDVQTSSIMVGMESYVPLVRKDQVPIEKAIIHPEYTNAKNDVALIKLARAANSHAFARLAGFNPAEEPPAALTNVPLTAVGFGLNENNVHPNVLHKIIVAALPDEECINVPAGYPDTNQDPDFHLCAGSGIEDGDSGGPLYADYHGNRYVVGLVSRSLYPFAEQFTRVSHFAEWIRATMAG